VKERLDEIKTAFDGLQFPNDAVRSLANMAVERLETAVEDKKTRAEEEWYDRCMKIAMSAPSISQGERHQRVAALAARRRKRGTE
jgi:hypothetical protein